MWSGDEVLVRLIIADGTTSWIGLITEVVSDIY